MLSFFKKAAIFSLATFSLAKADIRSNINENDRIYMLPSKNQYQSLHVNGLVSTSATYSCLYRTSDEGTKLIGGVNPLKMTFALGSHPYVGTLPDDGYINIWSGLTASFTKAQEWGFNTKTYVTYNEGVPSQYREYINSSVVTINSYARLIYFFYKMQNTYAQMTNNDENGLTKLFLSITSPSPIIGVSAEFLVRSIRAAALLYPEGNQTQFKLAVSPRMLDKFTNNFEKLVNPDVVCP